MNVFHRTTPAKVKEDKKKGKKGVKAKGVKKPKAGKGQRNMKRKVGGRKRR